MGFASAQPILQLRPAVRHLARLAALCFANGPAASRAQSMKRCASGLSARFLSVKIATWRNEPGSPTGNTRTEGYLPGALMTPAGTTARNGPVAARLIRTLRAGVETAARGGLRPLARNASTTSMSNRLGGGGQVQRSFTS